MNLFVTSADPKVCAIDLDDKRLNKIITESAQILCTVLKDEVKNLPFKPTHHNHPVVIWADSTPQSLSWTLSYHRALVAEWRHRFNKDHGSELPSKIDRHIPPSKTPAIFHNGASNRLRELDFTWAPDVFISYQLYLSARWFNDKINPRWTKRDEPLWYNHSLFLWTNGYISRLLINRAQELIGKQRNGTIPCPRCGETLSYEDKDHFKCTSNNPRYHCLTWSRV